MAKLRHLNRKRGNPPPADLMSAARLSAAFRAVSERAAALCEALPEVRPLPAETAVSQPPSYAVATRAEGHLRLATSSPKRGGGR